MDPTEEAIKLNLKKLFSANSFHITTLDTCLKMGSFVIEKEDYDALRAVHCIDYSEMTPEFRTWVFDTVLKAFSEPAFNISKIERLSLNSDEVFQVQNQNNLRLLVTRKGLLSE